MIAEQQKVITRVLTVFGLCVLVEGVPKCCLHTDQSEVMGLRLARLT